LKKDLDNRRKTMRRGSRRMRPRRGVARRRGARQQGGHTHNMQTSHVHSLINSPYGPGEWTNISEASGMNQLNEFGPGLAQYMPPQMSSAGSHGGHTRPGLVKPRGGMRRGASRLSSLRRR